MRYLHMSHCLPTSDQSSNESHGINHQCENRQLEFFQDEPRHVIDRFHIRRLLGPLGLNRRKGKNPWVHEPRTRVPLLPCYKDLPTRLPKVWIHTHGDVELPYISNNLSKRITDHLRVTLPVSSLPTILPKVWIHTYGDVELPYISNTSPQ